MKILALDYGAKRIGAAVADTKIGIAHPRPFFCNGKNLGSELKTFCAKEDIATILVGIPTTLAGTSSLQTETTKTFAANLNRITGLPIIEIDERFSTKLAELNLREKALKRQEYKKYIDSEAARLLLQEYLEQAKP